jgi:hypothetical protein
MYNLLRISRFMFISNFIFWILYNSYFGWNTSDEITGTEIFFDNIYKIILYISVILYIIPLFQIYEGFVKLMDSKIKKK